MKKVAALAAVIAGFAVTGIAGATGAFAAGPSACASASAQVTVNGSDVVNQSVGQCAP
ncbi:MAG TPA: hypothetical protein VN193_04580 [Candidatus Angelobacter sp.]|jgi:hypothetical protein|nr:hypothetical protein [Candidatus Angelobacter sp.]